MPLVAVRQATFTPIGKQPVTANEAECAENPRARSAKLRSGLRTNAPAENTGTDILPVPNLAALAALGG